MDLEEKIEKYIFETIEFVFRYLKTTLDLCFHTNYFFNHYFSNDEPNKNYLRPGIFLVVNLLISNIVSLLLGKAFPKVPFENELLNKYITNVSYTFLIYVFGYFLASWIFSFVGNKFSERRVSLKNCFDILCYGSFTFLPLAFISLISTALYNGSLNNLLIKILYDLKTTHQFHINSLGYLGKLFFVVKIINLLILFVWARTIMVGLRNLRIRFSLLTVSLSFFLYYLINQLITYFLFACITFNSISPLHAWWDQTIQKEMGKSEPNLLLVLNLATEIRGEKIFPYKLRYEAGLISFATTLEIIFPLNSNGLLKKTYSLLQANQNFEASRLIKHNIDQIKNHEFFQGSTTLFHLKEGFNELENIKIPDPKADNSKFKLLLNNWDENKDSYWIENEEKSHQCSLSFQYSFIELLPL